MLIIQIKYARDLAIHLSSNVARCFRRQSFSQLDPSVDWHENKINLEENKQDSSWNWLLFKGIKLGGG